MRVKVINCGAEEFEKKFEEWWNYFDHGNREIIIRDIKILRKGETNSFYHYIFYTNNIALPLVI